MCRSNKLVMGGCDCLRCQDKRRHHCHIPSRCCDQEQLKLGLRVGDDRVDLFNGQEVSFVGEDGITIDLQQTLNGPQLTIGNDGMGVYSWTVSAANDVDGPDIAPSPLAVPDTSNVRVAVTGGLTATPSIAMDGSRTILLDGSNAGQPTDLSFALANVAGDDPPAVEFSVTDGDQVQIVPGTNVTASLTNPSPGIIAYTINSAGTDFEVSSADDQAGAGEITFPITNGQRLRLWGSGGIVTTLVSLGGGIFAMQIDGSAISGSGFNYASADDQAGVGQILFPIAPGETIRVWGSGGIVATLVSLGGGIFAMQIDGSNVPGIGFNYASALDQTGLGEILFPVAAGETVRVWGSGGILANLVSLGGGVFAMQIDGSGITSSFDITDGVNTEAVSSGDTLTINGDNNITVQVNPGPTIDLTYQAVLATFRNGLGTFLNFLMASNTYTPFTLNAAPGNNVGFIWNGVDTITTTLDGYYTISAYAILDDMTGNVVTPDLLGDGRLGIAVVVNGNAVASSTFTSSTDLVVATIFNVQTAQITRSANLSAGDNITFGCYSTFANALSLDFQGSVVPGSVGGMAIQITITRLSDPVV